MAGFFVGLLFFGIGIAVMIFGWKWVGAKTLEVRHWNSVPCVVTRWEVGITPAGTDVYKPALELAYQYEAGGQTHRGTVLNAAWDSLPALNDLEQQGAAARAGGQVCYVNPADPSQSSLQPGSWMWPGLIMGFGLLFAGAGGTVLLGSSASIFRRVTGNPAVLPAPGLKGCLGTLIAPFFWLIFAGAGLAVWKFAIHDVPDWKGIAPGMTEIPAKILASGVERHTSSGRSRSTTYKAKVAFIYRFADRDWHSGWLDFDGNSSSSSNRKAAAAAAARHPAGQATTCWVNPAAPWQAVLEKQGGPRWWLWLFPVLFGGIGLTGFAGWGLKLLRRVFAGR